VFCTPAAIPFTVATSAWNSRVLGPARIAPAREQVDLQQADRVDVGISQPDALLQALVLLQQRLLAF
jgi:hypothetical protein